MFYGFSSSGTVGEDSTSFEFLSVHSPAYDKRNMRPATLKAYKKEQSKWGQIVKSISRFL
jgi:hypothetical protein